MRMHACAAARPPTTGSIRRAISRVSGALIQTSGVKCGRQPIRYSDGSCTRNCSAPPASRSTAHGHDRLLALPTPRWTSVRPPTTSSTFCIAGLSAGTKNRPKTLSAPIAATASEMNSRKGASSRDEPDRELELFRLRGETAAMR